jgi:hypothetical protein
MNQRPIWGRFMKKTRGKKISCYCTFNSANVVNCIARPSLGWVAFVLEMLAAGSTWIIEFPSFYILLKWNFPSFTFSFCEDILKDVCTCFLPYNSLWHHLFNHIILSNIILKNIPLFPSFWIICSCSSRDTIRLTFVFSVGYAVLLSKNLPMFSSL